MLDRPTGTPHPPAMGRRERPRAGLASDAAIPDGAAILAILRRRKWLLLAPMLLCPLLAYIALSQFNPLYTATGTLLYDANGAQRPRTAEHPSGRPDHRRHYGEPG